MNKKTHKKNTGDHKWQAPGNGRIFDGTFNKIDQKHEMNIRSIGSLKYIQKKKVTSIKDFEKDIWNYLNSHFPCKKQNKTLIKHFFNPLIFFGFLNCKNNLLRLTIEGELFLRAFDAKDFSRCKSIFLNQLDNTYYPNNSTTHTTAKLYPFRILFKLLLNHKKLSINQLKSQIVHIEKAEDVKNISKKSKHEYDKFYSWVISSLIKLEILSKKNDYIEIHSELAKSINDLYKNVPYESMFIDNDLPTHVIDSFVGIKRYKRDAELPAKVKDKYNHTCFIGNNHKTFLCNDVNYVEAHHIIPMFQQKNFKEYNLDTIDNMICLCPNCHKEVHLADKKSKIIKKMYSHASKFLKKISIYSLKDLEKIYL